MRKLYLWALVFTAAALAALALAGCSSSAVDDGDAGVYLVITLDNGVSILCGQTADGEFSVEVRPKTSDANSDFNDVILSKVKLSSSDTSKVMNVNGTFTDTLCPVSATTAVVIEGLLASGVGCTDDGLSTKASVTLSGETISGDPVSGSVTFIVANDCDALESVTVTGNTAPASGVSDTYTTTVVGGFGPYTYTWDFGDLTGTTVNTTASTSNAVSHTYAAPGSYTITVTVDDSCPNGVQTEIGTLDVTAS
jgi:hypothetical protein